MSTKMAQNRVLIVEDEISIAKMIAMNLKVAGYETKMFHDGREAAEALEEERAYDKVLERTKKLSDVIRILDVEINFLEHSVRKNGEEVLLKPMEFELLCVLARNKNIAISREELLRRVWGMDYLGETRTVDVHIGQLRKKLSLNDNIKTVSKMGYRLED